MATAERRPPLVPFSSVSGGDQPSPVSGGRAMEGRGGRGGESSRHDRDDGAAGEGAGYEAHEISQRRRLDTSTVLSRYPYIKSCFELSIGRRIVGAGVVRRASARRGSIEP